MCSKHLDGQQHSKMFYTMCSKYWVHDIILKWGLLSQIPVIHFYWSGLNTSHFSPSQAPEALPTCITSFSCLTSAPRRQAAHSSNCYRDAISQPLNKHQKINICYMQGFRSSWLIQRTTELLIPSVLKKSTAFIFKGQEGPLKCL